MWTIKNVSIGIALLSIAGCSTSATSVYGPDTITLTPAQLLELTGYSGTANNSQHSDVDPVLMAMLQMSRDPEVTDYDDFKIDLSSSLMAQSEAICEAYLIDVLGYRNTVDSSLSVAGLAFGTAAAIVSPMAGDTSKILAGLSTLSQSSNKELSRSFYGDADLAIVGKTIRANRRIKRIEYDKLLLKGKMQKLPFGSIYARVLDYHAACSLNAGIDSLKATAQNAVEEKEEKAEEVATKNVEALIN